MAVKLHESIDTNIILRTILGDVPEQCLRIQDLFMRHDVIYEIADLALEEVVYVLQESYNWSRRNIVEAVQATLEMAHFNYNEPLFSAVFPMYVSHPKLSFNDCCLAVYAKLNGAEPLWTFDKNLARQSPTAKILA